ncbi:cobalt-precorrin-6A reductase [Pelagibius sp.]|uniref:cobalt-precorrin-6A reductase n=1 Tax=Pelagibius sp. TaxID=1931238 RepID=UPI003B4FFC6D
MSELRRILLLGGTEDSRALAEGLSKFAGVEVVSSLAGRTEQPLALPGSLRIGGFGGVEALARYLDEEHIDLLVDATHPFAARISENAEVACRRSRTPRLVVQRQAWQAVEGDRWIRVPSAEAAAQALHGLAKRVFVTVGRQELSAFEALRDIWFLVRMIDPPRQPLPLVQCHVVLGRGPFEECGERALVQEHGIEALVTKNSGGAATYAKVAVARDCGLPVVMIDRPFAPPGETVDCVEDALNRIAKMFHLGERGPAHEAR